MLTSLPFGLEGQLEAQTLALPDCPLVSTVIKLLTVALANGHHRDYHRGHQHRHHHRQR